MFNRLRSVWRRPERGWDPVSAEQAERYAQHQWENLNLTLVDRLERQLGGLQGKRVLDLGGGPGQYSVAFAQRGAEVNWHDISARYQRIARSHAEKAGVDMAFSLGYLEEAASFVERPFDLVFCRICWLYCMNDRAFAKLFYSLIRPGGAGYIDANNTAFAQEIKGKRIRYFFNTRLGWKIGYPHPPRGRIARLIQRYPIKCMELDYSSRGNDTVFFTRSMA